MARNRGLTVSVGERLLASKLQILNGTGGRRPSTALSILTGAAPVLASDADDEPTKRQQYLARTVYLTQRHLNDIDRIIVAWEQSSPGSRRPNRSAVLRRAVEQLRTLVEAQSPLLLENE